MPAESLSFRPSTALHAKLLHVALEGPAVESGRFWYDPSNHHLRAALGAYY